jgi:hypothetical protein
MKTTKNNRSIDGLKDHKVDAKKVKGGIVATGKLNVASRFSKETLTEGKPKERPYKVNVYRG